MTKLILSFLYFYLTVSTYAQLNIIKDKKELNKLYSKLNHEISSAAVSIDPSSVTNERLNNFLNLYNQGKVEINFISDKGSRGKQASDDSCNCSVIYLSSDYIDSGVVSTLIHEFEHVRHELLLGNRFFKNNPELDKLTDIFGEYYYGNDQSTKLLPNFEKALYVGSAFLFYTEYKAFSAQVESINDGVKDNIRPERSENDVIETVANNYFIDHKIGIDSNYAIALANIAKSSNPKEFLLKISKDKNLYNYFISLQ